MSRRPPTGGRFYCRNPNPAIFTVPKLPMVVTAPVVLSTRTRLLSDRDVFDYGPGEFFGEIALLSDKRRTEAASAQSDCFLIESPRLTVSRLMNSSTEVRDKEWAGMKYSIQVAPEDCTGCGICVEICPAKNKAETRLKALNMEPQPPLRVPERENWDFFLTIPELRPPQDQTHHHPAASSNFRALAPGAAKRPT